MRRPLPTRTILAVLLMAFSISQAAAAKLSSNREVGKRVDEITRDPRYRWLRKDSGQPSRVNPQGSRLSPAGSRAGEFTSDEGNCSYEPSFRDVPVVDDNDGCQPISPGDCSCQPDLGNCGFDPGTVQCGTCAAPGAVFQGTGYALGILAIGIFVFLVVKALLKNRIPRQEGLNVSDVPEEIRMSGLDLIPASALMEEARVAAERGDYKGAVGYSYLAGISALSRAGLVVLDRSTTNWKIVRTTKRKGGPHGPVATLVTNFEDLFFGGKEPTMERWEECRGVVDVHLASLQPEVES